MNDIKYKVYKYIFPNGKVYIGCTHYDLAERRDCGYRHNPTLKTAMREFGWRNIKKVIIQDNLDRDTAFALEIATIANLNATDPEIGYNISLGGIAAFEGRKHTQESKDKIRNSRIGKTASPESRERMKEAHKAERIAVTGTDADGNTKFYESLTEAADDVGGYKSNITRACKSGSPYKDIMWAFYERGCSRCDI